MATEQEDPGGLAIVVGTSGGDHVIITPGYRMYPESADYSDGNWFTGRIEIKAGAFTAKINADLYLPDFERLRLGLENLYANLNASAQLESLEPWLNMTFDGDGKGHVIVDGSARDGPSFDNKLQFRLTDYDQTYLPELIDQLRQLESALPIRGRPS